MCVTAEGDFSGLADSICTHGYPVSDLTTAILVNVTELLALFQLNKNWSSENITKG